MKPTLLVLAAGMGSRYGGLKQMDPVGPSGETIIDYSVFDAIRAGFDKVVFVIRPDFEAAFKASLGARFGGQIDLGYAFQELSKIPQEFTVPQGREKPWGTGQALLMAREAVRKPFAVINADDFYGAEAFQKMARFLESESSDWAMVGYRLRQTLSEHGSVARGVCQIEGDYLKRVEELTKIERQGEGAVDKSGPQPRSLTGEEIVSMNFWGFRPEVFDLLDLGFREFLAKHGGELKSEYYIPMAVDQWIRKAKAKVQVLKTSASWFGVTYKEDKDFVQRSVKAMIDNNFYPKNLWA